MDNGASSYRRFRDNGDKNALVEIIRDYKDGLILYLTSIVGNIHIAEELAEDTFVLLGTKKPKDKGKGSFKTWLYTIGRNVAIDYLRKHSKHIEVSIDDNTEILSDENDVELEYIKKEQKIIVHKAMRKLPPEYQQVLSASGDRTNLQGSSVRCGGRSIRMKEFLIKLALDIIGDKETREKIGIVILSIVVGVVLLLFAPVALLMSMGEIEPPDVTGNFDQSAWMQSLDSEQQDKITQMKSAGQQIASAMESVGVREQTIKAQLIYISCFEDVTVDDFNAYANLFRYAPDDAALINSINQNYGLEIVYEDFMRSYALISHVVINPYMFTDAQTKNSTDLVIWARQAYENDWGYVYGTYGNILTKELLQDRASMFGEQVTGFEDFIRENWMCRRTADCVGLIKGYGWYNPDSEEIVVGSNGMADVTANGMFDAATVKGTIDTIPEVPGLAVWQDGHIGIYIGNGEVIEAMGTEQGVVKTTLPSGWTHWLEIPYISYATTEEPTTEESQEG